MRLWLDPDAEAIIESEARCHRILETGGPLFGWFSDDKHPVVAIAHGPGPNARHKRTRFLPDQAETQRLIDKHYKETEGLLRYLGEWHTHPFGEARPSSRDTATLVQISTATEARLPTPVALILQTKPLLRRVGIGELGAFQVRSESCIGRLPVERFSPGQVSEILSR